MLISAYSGLPRWYSSKESACQCRGRRRHGFDLWVRKIPWKRKWQPILIFLPGKIPWTEEPGAYCQSMRFQRVGHYGAHMHILHQFSSAAQSCPTLCGPMNRSTPGLPVHHQLPEFTQTHVHRVSDAMQPSHPGSSPSPPAPNPSQHQSLFQWVNSSREVAKVLEFQL